MHRLQRYLTAAILVAAAPQSLRAQDDFELGKMWTFENPPLDYLEAEYGFRPTEAWLTSLRMASLRFGTGCSASFVSPKGLIMTNHHCVRDKIAEVQGEGDWVRDGFVARSAEDELRLPGLTVQQLVSTRDVTAEVDAGIEEGASPEEISEAREANKRRLVQDARRANSELRSEIVELFQGASFQLYSYRVFADIRLVAAPHLQASHFGGDFDNFTYPRFGIDFAFCRAYEDGEPADTSANYFRWSRTGAKREEVVFLTGNPGGTDRLLTKAQLEYQRDARYPRIRELIDNRLEIMRAAAAESPDAEKRLRTTLLSFENAQKAYRGEHEALLDDAYMARKAEAERKFRARIDADPELAKKFGGVWDQLAAVAEAQKALEGPASFQQPGGSPHLDRAVALVRRAMGDARAGFDPRVIPTEMGGMQLSFFVDHLSRARAWLPPDDPYLQAVLRGREPADAAQWLAANSRIGDAAFVLELMRGGADAIEASDDPAIEIARGLVPLMERNRQAAAELEARAEVLGTQIGLALFAAYGTMVSPDATFTARFSDGRVRGYAYNGTRAPYRTVFYGMYARNAEFDDEFPFNLPPIWLERKDRIDMNAPVNFVCTVDSTGGNSGSPVVTRELEIVGLLFDGNIESLSNQFMYSEESSERSVCVHVRGIIEALTKIYDADRIVDELFGR